MKHFASEKELLIVERISYGLILLPFLSDYLETGRMPYGPRELITEVTLGTLILCYIAVVRRARRRLVTLERSRLNLQQLIVHDLKNPITSALCSISVLQQNSVEQERRNALLNVALNSCRQEVKLIDQILEVDRLELTELPIRNAMVNVRELAESAVAEVRGAASLKDVDVRVEVPFLIPRLCSDSDLLRRVLMNLLSNALKYTPAGGRVTVAAAFQDDGFRFSVTDTGDGIPSDKLPKIFSKFYRVEGSNQAVYRGTGLGLYFCRMAVEALGGGIGIKSDLGKGTAVDFFLPENRGVGKFAGRFRFRRIRLGHSTGMHKSALHH